MKCLYTLIFASVLAVQPSSAAAAFVDKMFQGSFMNCTDPENPCIWDNLGAVVGEKAFRKAARNVFAEYPIATRLFSGPTQYPPTEYGAYGILAFTSRPVEQTHERHVAICRAYINKLPSATAIEDEKSKQLVTIWPIKTDSIADKLNEKGNSVDCNEAITNYNHTLAKRAISAAKKGDWKPTGNGPYLLAWAPGTTLGKEDTTVLAIDLSNIVTYEQALAMMNHWANDIESDKSTWDDGFTLESVREYLQRWADTFGPDIWRLIKI